MGTSTLVCDTGVSAGLTALSVALATSPEGGSMSNPCKSVDVCLVAYWSARAGVLAGRVSNMSVSTSTGGSSR